MRLAFYPGCSLESSAREYRESTVLAARSLGLELEEIPEWICCGSTPAHMSDELLSIALPSYSLLLARGMDTEGVLVTCASCYSRLRAANHAVSTDKKKHDEVAEALGEPYEGDVPVYHMLELTGGAIQDPGFEAKIKRKLSGLKVASYYGCLLVRPPEITGFDDAEDPQSLDNLVSAVGAEPVDWRYKVECCGAALAFSNADIVHKLSGEIIRDAQDAGADVIIVACPLCHSNLDLRQRNIEKYLGVDLEVPVIYFTQLLGLAFGYSARELGLGKHAIDPVPVLKKRGINI
ncbi:MAG: CoB--CoM heterodisulfide reductase iron-sulfur subunit B family protein [Candidatus Eisenbacteria bacterium]